MVTAVELLVHIIQPGGAGDSKIELHKQKTMQLCALGPLQGQ